MDSYEEVRSWLYKQLPMYQQQGAVAYKPGLKKMKDFMTYLGNPDKNFNSIHVAGTNGKGSTAHMITSVLMEAGCKVGLYTSPHLKDFTERIRINGIAIETAYVVAFVQKHKSYFIDAQLSFFELTVGMSFEYFSSQNIDYAVVEVGLGGRLDATNIITPVLSVITNIGFDHTQFLGNTLVSIAKEKAGIIKENVHIVIGETQSEIVSVFQERSNLLKAPITFADAEEIHSHQSDLKGLYQSKNTQTAVVALNKLGLDKIKRKHVASGLLKVVSNTNLKGRWQVLREAPYVVADVTHNAAGFSYVVEQIKKTPHRGLHLVLGFVKEKDLVSIFEILPKKAIYYFSAPNIKRAEEVSTLIKHAENYKLQATAYKTIDIAYKSALKSAGAEDFIYVGGSAFVVAEIL